MDINIAVVPRALKDILVDLAFIGKVTKNRKLNIKSKSFADASSNIDAVKRWWYAEDKFNTLAFVEKRVGDGIDALTRYSSFKDDIIEHLKSAKEGILYLLEIYHDTPDITSSLEICNRDIETAVIGVASSTAKSDTQSLRFETIDEDVQDE